LPSERGTIVRYRLAAAADLAQCSELLPSAFKVSARVRAELPGLWRSLIKTNAANVVVFEDADSIEGCAISVHVSDAFADDVVAEPKPYLSARFYEEVLAGRSPSLSPAEIRTANSSTGLNLLVLHFGLHDHDVSAERSRPVLRAGGQAFFFFNTGYRYRLLLNEVYGRRAAEYMRAGGLRLLHEFEQHGDEAADRPFLFGLRKEWVARGAVNEMSWLFDPTEPRFGFTPAEQSVLLRALLNESDAEIAAHTGVSPDSVKKTWRRAFDRAAAVAPHLFAADGPDGGAQRARSRAARHQPRGSEKRRHLLDHLRLHLEELRPREATKRRNA
jgi:hypothetical protein